MKPIRAIYPPLLLTALFFTSLLYPLAPAWATTKVLMVGIDQYPKPVPSLRGCVNDLNRFREVLIKDCGVPSRSIQTLTNRRATRVNIVQAFEQQLIEGVAANDVVIFYFSGHGTHTPDLNGDESDGQDEALCPHDIDPTRPDTWLTDDMIRGLLERVPTSNVMVVLDCCHSGTGNPCRPTGLRRDSGHSSGLHLPADQGTKATTQPVQRKHQTGLRRGHKFKGAHCPGGRGCRPTGQ